jgi:spermidine synthase
VAARGVPVTIAVFTSGAVLLGVELAASRVVSPFFGNSLFVWGALIGVVLAGLAVGYWIGGTVADRLPATALLVGALALGAVAVLLVPVVDDPVLEWVVSWDPGPRADPVVAAVILFAVPSVLLASVTPIAVRLRARELTSVGSTAGGLFAVSTIGSIVGTFSTAFWLVPELGTDQLFGFAAAALFAAATIVALTDRRAVTAIGAAAACAAAVVAGFLLAPETGGTLSTAAARNWSPVYRLHEDVSKLPPIDYGSLEVVYRKDTRYHRLAVVQSDEHRMLRFGSSYQSAMDLHDHYRTVYTYTDFFSLALAYRSHVRSMLFLGLGGGSAQKRMWRDFPRLHLQVAELDPVVVDVARRFFAVPDDPRLRVAVDDGRQYLDKTDRQWDAIAVDTYFDDGVPFHMTTREFVELARRRLAPGGVVLVNIIGAVSGEGSKLFRAMYRTYRTVFPTVLVHPVEGGTGYQNIILVATDQPAPAKEVLLGRWRRVRAASPTAPDLALAIRDRYDGEIATDDVPTLTDDYAPTDALLVD